MKKTILMVAMAGMMVAGSVANAGLMVYRGYMPGTWDGIDYTARNDHSASDIAQIEDFLGFGDDQFLSYVDKWEAGGPSDEGILSVEELLPESGDDAGLLSGNWATTTGVSVLTVKADGMIGIWSTNIGPDPEFDFTITETSGEWDVLFTQNPPGEFDPGAAMSHITVWNGIGDDGDREWPTVAEPATMGLLFLGMAGIAAAAGRRKKKMS